VHGQIAHLTTQCCIVSVAALTKQTQRYTDQITGQRLTPDRDKHTDRDTGIKLMFMFSTLEFGTEVRWATCPAHPRSEFKRREHEQTFDVCVSFCVFVRRVSDWCRVSGVLDCVPLSLMSVSDFCPFGPVPHHIDTRTLTSAPWTLRGYPHPPTRRARPRMLQPPLTEVKPGQVVQQEAAAAAVAGTLPEEPGEEEQGGDRVSQLRQAHQLPDEPGEVVQGGDRVSRLRQTHHSGL
jgi:hypothetical protein